MVVLDGASSRSRSAEISLPADGLVLIAGANNAGKVPAFAVTAAASAALLAFAVSRLRAREV